jgi:hypothetical protein
LPLAKSACLKNQGTGLAVPNNFTLEFSFHLEAWGQEHTQDVPTQGCEEEPGGPNMYQSKFLLGTTQVLCLANGCKAKLLDELQKAKVLRHHYPVYPNAVRHES